MQEFYSRQQQEYAAVSVQPSTLAKRTSLFMVVISFVMLAILLALIPWLLTFHPPAGIGVSVYAPYVDAMASVRQQILLLALATFAISFFFSIFLQFAIVKRMTPLVLLQHALTLTILTIAMRAYPYWVNGLYIVGYEAGSGKYDPKDMQPANWPGFFWPIMAGLWRLINMLPFIQLVSLGFGIYIFSTTILNLRKAWRGESVRNRYVWGAMLMAEILLLVIVIISYILTPNFWPWILD